MSNKLRPQYPDAKGVIAQGFDGNAILAEGASVPTDATAGYAPGCIYFLRAGGTFGGHYVNEGTALSCDFNLVSLGGVNLAALTATATELNTLHSQTLTTGAPAGITGGTGTVYKNSVQKSGGIFYTSIFLDLTGLGSSTTDLDVIGQGAAAAAHVGQITAAQCGTIEFGRLTCVEVPVTGVTDIDLYSATEGTAKFDDGIAALTETALVTAGGAWTLGLTKFIQDLPVADQYLYFTNGAAGTVGTYTAGKFMLELFGY